MSIANLTQHTATPEQIEAGVYDIGPERRARLTALLTFDAPPSHELMRDRARQIAELAGEIVTARPHAMIGGAPWFVRYVEDALLDAGIIPMHAFSRRESVEVAQPDGSVTKTAVFRHVGFVVPGAS